MTQKIDLPDSTGGWARATEKSTEATTEIVHAGRELGNSVSPAWEVLVGIATDQLQYVRHTRRLRLFEKYRILMTKNGIARPLKEAPPSFLIPLLEHATIETDDDLQDLWAALLANATDADNRVDMRTAFISMLSQMSHFAVTILAALSRVSKAYPDTGTLVTSHLPDGVGIMASNQSIPAPAPSRDVLVSLANLARLGCLLPHATYGGPSFNYVTLTMLGEEFIRSCTNES